MAFTELEPISRPINDFVFPRLNIARPLTPHSVPLRRAAPAFIFTSLLSSFAFAQRAWKLAAGLSKPKPHLTRASGGERKYCESRYAPLSFVYCIRATKCQQTFFSCVLLVKTLSERTGRRKGQVKYRFMTR